MPSLGSTCEWKSRFQEVWMHTLSIYVENGMFNRFQWRFQVDPNASLIPNTSVAISMEPTPAMWQETYVSALLRAIRYADDPSYRLAGYRKLDPITTPEAEQRFLEAAEAVFFRGMRPCIVIDSSC
jgi:hypothetical protein